MNDLPPEAPRLDPIPFIVADVLLVGAAALIGWQAEAPLGVAPLACISALVGLGAIAGLYPFVVNHARRQEEAVQERANQIEALARTVGAAAEQISIAVANLPAIAEQASRQLKAAEQLPADLQARLANLQHQLSATASEENAALRHELDTLRAAETGKLTSALEGLGRATADLERLETLAAKHSSALDAAIAQLPHVADSFGRQASEALRRETAAAIAALQAAASQSGAALAAATDEARSAFDRGVRDAVSHLATQAASNPPFPAHALRPQVIAPAEPVVIAPVASAPEPVPVVPPAPEPETPSAPAAPPAPEPETEPAITPEPDTEIDDTGLDEPAAPATETPLVETAITEFEPEPEAVPEPAPEPAEVSTPESTEESAPDTASEESTEPESSVEPEETPSAPAEAALSHDGYTRLVATAYIGIGNKLFIRGDGPGLRRDKGVPLQFVSIGKWRWESAELLFPVKVKLYKNDQVECTAVGELVLEPGHHHEVNATF